MAHWRLLASKNCNIDEYIPVAKRIISKSIAKGSYWSCLALDRGRLYCLHNRHRHSKPIEANKRRKVWHTPKRRTFKQGRTNWQRMYLWMRNLGDPMWHTTRLLNALCIYGWITGWWPLVINCYISFELPCISKIYLALKKKCFMILIKTPSKSFT